ncbi:MAG: helix-turn-helix transcriptional regulator [Actinobacteria bacterium]|nr:helix-turn-helix transcriptional regulator [Actinomycetota bacterium]
MNTNISESKGYSNLDFARALLELKNASGLSYMKIAVKAGVSDTYLVNIVQGKNLAPNDENIRKIAGALNVKPEYFKEYRQRRLAEKLDTLNFHKTNYRVALSEAEANYLKKIIDDHFAAKKKKKNK